MKGKKVLLILAFSCQLTYADEATDKQISQLQDQLKQAQTQQSQQVTNLNNQLQLQLKQVETDLQQQIQTANSQTQQQLKDLQSNIQQQLAQLQRQIGGSKSS